MRYRFRSLLILLVALGGCATQHPYGHGRATLHGIVYGSCGAPLGWVRVEADGHQPVFTDIDGRFFVAGVEQGPLAVRTTKEGYEPTEKEVTFTNRAQVLYVRMQSGLGMAREAQRRIDAGDVAEARAAAARALEIAPDEPTVRFIAAVVFVRCGNRARARDVLDSFPEDNSPPAVRLLRDRLEPEETL